MRFVDVHIEKFDYPFIKENEAGFVQRPIVRSSPLKRSGMDHTVVTLQTHHTCLYLVAFTRWHHQSSVQYSCDQLTD